MLATPATVSLTRARLPAPGWISPRRLLCRDKRRTCLRKGNSSLITAKFELKPPPYHLDWKQSIQEELCPAIRIFSESALEPHMSRETLEYHWGKHHRGYVENLNRQIGGTELDGLTLEDIITITYNKGDFLPAFNNAAQVWNHDFFWETMKPDGGGEPSGDLLELIERDFGSFERFVEEFKLAASTQFGSGWAWLAYKANRLDVGNAVNPCPSEQDKKLVVVKSPNAINPLLWDYCPLLSIDVWEHAYYLDFQIRRADYISIFMEKLISWEAVGSRLEMAKAQVAEREREEERRKRAEEEEQTPHGEATKMFLESIDGDDSESE